jgi:hypothetical protein
MTQCLQASDFLRRRNRRQDKRQRQLEKLLRWRQRKAEIRQARIAAGWRPEPKPVRWHRFEVGVRDKLTGQTEFVDLKSVRHAAKALGFILKFYH